LVDNRAFIGAERLPSGTTDINQMNFIVRQILSGISTATIVMVKAVVSDGELAEAGLVDIEPMVAQIDGEGGATPHGTIHNVPYLRIQGGANAVIIDPAVGDIGIALFASRDISSVKANKAPANPGSRRQFDMADAIYIGGLLNGVPTQYVRFSPDGIEVQSETLVKIIAPDVEIEGDVKITGDVEIDGSTTTTGDIDADGTITADVNVIGGGKSLNSHTHSGVTSGGGTSGPPS
jgi:Phage protein Gp138 N-terminal domain/GpV Apex motif